MLMVKIYEVFTIVGRVTIIMCVLPIDVLRVVHVDCDFLGRAILGTVVPTNYVPPFRLVTWSVFVEVGEAIGIGIGIACVVVNVDETVTQNLSPNFVADL